MNRLARGCLHGHGEGKSSRRSRADRTANDHRRLIPGARGCNSDDPGFRAPLNANRQPSANSYQNDCGSRRSRTLPFQTGRDGLVWPTPVCRATGNRLAHRCRHRQLGPERNLGGTAVRGGLAVLLAAHLAVAWKIAWPRADGSDGADFEPSAQPIELDSAKRGGLQ